MRALSIKEPWISKILSGEKTIELRTWTTKYRGPILLCASASPKSELSGMAVCVVDLIEIRQATNVDDAAACHPASGKMAWIIANVRPVERFPVKGRLGIFQVEI